MASAIAHGSFTPLGAFYPANMRLFIGFTPPEAATHHLAEYLATMRASQAWSSLSQVRWVPPEHWHVTVAFLGDVDDGRVRQITAALGTVASDHARLPSMHLAELGRFPTALWVGVHPTERFSPADRLARAVQRTMRGVGVQVERRPWRAHLTIARLRGLQSSSALPALAPYSGPGWSVDAIQLVESITGPIPRYQLVEQFSLRAAPPTQVN